MQATRFEARVRHREDVAVLDLIGQIDREAEAVLGDAFARAAAAGPATILLSFREVDYINSTGIALVVGLLARTRTLGIALAACALSPHYREIFEITRLSDFVRVYATEAEVFGDAATPAG